MNAESFAVRDRVGECYAVRESYAEAVAAKASAADYLYEAAACGHPRAAGWVAERLPLSIVRLTPAEVEAVLDEGVPVLDREP
jgi:hypothetical protein